MRENPCRYCVFGVKYRNTYRPSWVKTECRSCQRLELHQKYLESKRKFDIGEPITNIEDLLNETWVIFLGRTKHIEMFKSMQLRSVMNFLKSGYIKKAIPRVCLENKVEQIK